MQPSNCLLFLRGTRLEKRLGASCRRRSISTPLRTVNPSRHTAANVNISCGLEPSMAIDFVDAFDMSWSISGRVTLTSSAPPPIPAATPILHQAYFRFYRLSQLTDDLFDAYRNAYLCLECLVSAESPKSPSESEVAWLKRVLGGSLLAGLPTGIAVDQTVERLYKRGRLPLFHAKTGASFYSPQGAERERVQPLFAELTTLLAALFRYKFGNSSSGGWASMSQEVYDAQARAVFQFDEVVYKCESERVTLPPKVEVVSNPRRFGNPWARLDVAKPTALTSIDGVEFLHNGGYWCGLEFPESLPMENVASVSFEFGLLQYNIRAPKPSHAM